MATFRQQNRGFCGCAPVPYPADTLAQLKSFIKENLATYDSDENTSAESTLAETGYACASTNACTDEHDAFVLLGPGRCTASGTSHVRDDWRNHAASLYEW